MVNVTEHVNIIVDSDSGAVKELSYSEHLFIMNNLYDATVKKRVGLYNFSVVIILN